MPDPDWPVFEVRENCDDGYELTDVQGREYTHVGSFLENGDFYQGLNKISVIRRKSDGKLFGYSWWHDISKYGDALIEPNGSEYGLVCDTDANDWDNYVSYYVFEPVVESSIVIYKK